MFCFRDMTFCSGSDKFNFAFPNEEDTICNNKQCFRHACNIPNNVLHPKDGDFQWPIAWTDFRSDCNGYTGRK